jgi:hypothetical protein
MFKTYIELSYDGFHWEAGIVVNKPQGVINAFGEIPGPAALTYYGHGNTPGEAVRQLLTKSLEIFPSEVLTHSVERCVRARLTEY